MKRRVGERYLFAWSSLYGAEDMQDLCPKIRPVGRKISPQRVQYIALAKSAKLGTVQRFQLTTLAQGLPCTGLLNGTEAHLLLVLINTASKESFERSGQPIVFKSNRQLAFEINRSENRVSFLLSRLFDAGMVTMQDSGNYKRFSGRPVEGQATDACGIDLKILVARYQELSDLVQKAKAEQAATHAAVRRFRGAVRLVRSVFEGSRASNGILCDILGARCERILTIVGAPRTAGSALLKRATKVLEWIVDRLCGVQKTTHEVSSNKDSIGLLIDNDMHIQNTNPYQIVDRNRERSSADAEQQNQHRAGYASKGAYEKSLLRGEAQNKRRLQPQSGMVSLHDLLRAAPVVRETWGISVRSWADLIRAIPQMAVCGGISPDARDEAVKGMGEQAAAVAIALTLQKQETREVVSAGGYLRAMTERAATGDLHLARSVHAMVSRNYAGVAN